MINRRTLLGAGVAATGLSALGARGALADSRIPWGQLEQRLQGDLILPSDAGYASAKQLDLMQYDSISPQAVAFCQNPADVALCLAFAQDNGVRVAPRSGGHSLGGYSTTKGLVIDVSRINAITVNQQSVRLGAGAQNVDVLNALAPSGLVAVGGACPTVGAGGFIQGGGVGFLTRSLGVACDQLTSVDVVLANGRRITASPAQHSDLFWALRGGGGGNFGVVTSYTLNASPLTMVATATLTYGYDRALDMLDGYARWLPGAPRTIGGAAVVTLADAAPGGTPVPMVIMVSTGTAEELASETDRLVALTGAPLARSAASVPYQALMMGIYGCSSLTVEQCHRAGTVPLGQLPRTAFALERSRLFTAPMPRTGWASALAVFDTQRVAGQTHQIQVLPLGGAAGDLSRTATAYVHRDSLYCVVMSASIPAAPVSADQQAAATAWATAGFNAINPYSNGETYQNFIDPTLADWRSAYYAENYARLVTVKSRYDPGRVFSFAQGVG